MSKLFGEFGCSENVSVADSTVTRIRKLINDFTSADRCRMVLEYGDLKSTCTSNNSCRLWIYMQCVCLALKDVLENMPIGKK